MALPSHSFDKEALDEVFPNPAIREVAFEIRFAPRLRVNAELWKLQDQLVEEYPNTIGEMVILQPGGPALNVSVFQNPTAGRVIKVSQENLVVAFTSYTCFEDFKAEVLVKTQKFCSTFEVSTLARVGLRYVNNIILESSEDAGALLKFVRPLTDFDRVDVSSVDSFINEIRMKHNNHMVTLRGALLPLVEDRTRTYILDIDCHTDSPQPAGHIEQALDVYHDSAQRFFLDHITDEYKRVMRGKR